MEEKDYIIEDFREGLGLNANAGHSIKVVGRKAAAFTNRVKTAISTNYHKAANAIREKVGAAKDAIVNAAGTVKDTVVTKAGEIKTGVVNTATHAMNSVDMHAYRLAQNDYQKIMNKKTAKLDDKIADISDKMEAIKNASVGYGKDQVLDEKERSYLLHRAEDLINKYTKERNQIASETMQIANYEKGQNEKIKIAGKRRILIGALDLKRITTNVAKATVKTAGAILSVPGKIAKAAGNTMSKMQEKMLERQIMKEAKKQQEAEAQRIALEEAEQAKLLEEMEGKTAEEVFMELTDDEVALVEQMVEIVSQKTADNMEVISKNMNYNKQLEELRKASPKAAYVVDGLNNQNEVQKGINEAADAYTSKADSIIQENPEKSIEMIEQSNKREEDKKAKEAANIEAEKEKAYNAGLEAGRKETAKEIAELKEIVAQLQQQMATLNTPAKASKAAKATPDYSSMTKNELLDAAKSAGLDVKANMKKADIIDSLSKSELQDLKEKVETNKKK